MNLKLSDNIRRLRRERDLTQDDIATELGISYQAVSRWETGSSYPDVEFLPALAAIFGVSMDALFGLDVADEEETERKYLAECDELEDIDEQIKLTRKYMAEYPSNTYFKYRLISRFTLKGLPVSEGNLCECRKLCRYIIDHTTDMDWWRDGAIYEMIFLEEEGNLDEWLSALDNRAIITSDKAMTDRYFFRGECEKYNEAIQKDIILSLTQMFSDDFCKSDAKTYKNAQSRAEGQRIILATIDVYREPSTDLDAWLATRAFAYMRLAAGLFGSGSIEEGYAALERSVDLYIAYDSLPEGTILAYNCPALDMLSVTVDKAEGCGLALEILTRSEGWEWFDCVRDEERFKARVERLRAACNR